MKNSKMQFKNFSYTRKYDLFKNFLYENVFFKNYVMYINVNRRKINIILFKTCYFYEVDESLGTSFMKLTYNIFLKIFH